VALQQDPDDRWELDRQPGWLRNRYLGLPLPWPRPICEASRATGRADASRRQDRAAAAAVEAVTPAAARAATLAVALP
jgi:hypothetical protein